MKSQISIPTDSTFATILEGLLDAVLISDIQGEVLYTNLSAQKICHQLNLTHLQSHAIWSICEVLKSHTDRSLILESELTIAETQYRIRVQWLNTRVEAQDDRMIVRFENEHYTLRGAIMFESQSFGLTQREAEVWELKRQGKSRREIADQLFISIDTVKKHIANIKVKRENYLNRGISNNRLNSPSL